MHAALHDSKEILRVIMDRRVFSEPIHRALCPSQRVVERVRSLFNGARVRRAFVEGHDDVGTDFALRLHHRFRGEHVARAVQMAMEFHALFGYVAQVLETPDLESAAVGKHRAIPAHKFLNAAHLGYEFRARTQVQVVRVREDNLRLHFAQVPRRKSLHARKSAHRHKNRRFHHAMGGVEPAAPGLALVASLYKFEGILVQ